MLAQVKPVPEHFTVTWSVVPLLRQPVRLARHQGPDHRDFRDSGPGPSQRQTHPGDRRQREDADRGRSRLLSAAGVETSLAGQPIHNRRPRQLIQVRHRPSCMISRFSTETSGFSRRTVHRQAWAIRRLCSAIVPLHWQGRGELPVADPQLLHRRGAVENARLDRLQTLAQRSQPVASLSQRALSQYDPEADQGQCRHARHRAGDEQHGLRLHRREADHGSRTTPNISIWR